MSFAKQSVILVMIIVFTAHSAILDLSKKDL